MDHLAWDVARAQRLGYGCHYGRYKVDHPHTVDLWEEEASQTRKPKRKEPELPAEPPKYCLGCGKEFLPRKNFANYCSVACRKADRARKASAWRREHKPKPADIPCEFCGKVFTQTRKGQKYCSRTCRGKAACQRKKLAVLDPKEVI